MIANAEKRATFSFLINGRKQMITSYLAINSGFIVLLGKSAEYGTSEDICGHLHNSLTDQIKQILSEKT